MMIGCHAIRGSTFAARRQPKEEDGRQISPFLSLSNHSGASQSNALSSSSGDAIHFSLS